MFGSLAVLGLAPGRVLAGDNWIEVVGAAVVSSPADRPAARRRALADALLSAALAGGADLQGHSVLSNTRMTSDLLVVRPTGRVLAYRVTSETFDGQLLRIGIMAQVGPPQTGACTERRRLVVVAYPVQVHVSQESPAWTEAFGQHVAAELLRRVAGHPAVAQVTLADRLPPARREATDYRTLTQGSVAVPPGGHALHMDLRIVPEDRQLRLSLEMRLVGAADALAATHDQAVRLPHASVLGRAAPLIETDRHRLASRLGAGAAPALTALLDRAGCQPVATQLLLAGGRLSAPVGRAQGVLRTSIAYTVDRDASTEMLEVTAVGNRTVDLAPLDPSRPLSAFAGRPVRFITTTPGLP
nr:flagellar assembly protein T N-terminal domain-containing protein [Paracoccus saliphilus]